MPSKYSLSGLGMHNLRGNVNAFIRKEFFKLPVEKQAEVKKQAARYFEACDKVGCQADRTFFVEVILDARDNTFMEKEVKECMPCHKND